MNEQSSKKRAKRQHLIPQFYLEHFALDSKVWVIDFHSDKPPYRNSVLNTLCVGDFYTVETCSAKEDDGVEKFLSGIESEAKPVLDDLLKDMVIPSGEARDTLNVFLATLYLRGPHFRQLQLELYEGMLKALQTFHFSDEAVFDKVYENFRVRQPDGKISREQARRILDDSTIEGFMTRESYVKSFLKALPRLPAIFGAMTLNVWWADPLGSARFVTGDFPFVIEDQSTGKFHMPPNGGLLNRYVRIYVPISPLVCLTLQYGKENNIYPIIDTGFVPIINSQLAVVASRYVISSTKDVHWFKKNTIRRSIGDLHGEFYPQKLNEPLIESGHPAPGQEVTARRNWNKLRGDKAPEEK